MLLTLNYEQIYSISLILQESPEYISSPTDKKELYCSKFPYLCNFLHQTFCLSNCLINFAPLEPKITKTKI